jgi:hypothetical protein
MLHHAIILRSEAGPCGNFLRDVIRNPHGTQRMQRGALFVVQLCAPKSTAPRTRHPVKYTCGTVAVRCTPDTVPQCLHVTSLGNPSLQRHGFDRTATESLMTTALFSKEKARFLGVSVWGTGSDGILSFGRCLWTLIVVSILPPPVSADFFPNTPPGCRFYDSEQGSSNTRASHACRLLHGKMFQREMP